MEEPSFVLLDIDGVLNRHGQNRHGNGYNGIEPECVAHFNRILKAVPEARIVVISSWRYDVHSGRMTVAGIEALLKTHGVDCHGRVFDVTSSDAVVCGNARSWNWLSKNGGYVRRLQVWHWLYGAEYEMIPPGDDDRRWVVIDDMDLGFVREGRSRQIVTNADIGLTAADADRAIAILRDKPPQWSSPATSRPMRTPPPGQCTCLNRGYSGSIHLPGCPVKGAAR